MAVNLEELALKSIEQYATLGVRLASLEQALIDSNRRFEQSQEKFIHACDKLSRLEEKIIILSDDRAIIHRRIDDTRAEVDKLIELVRNLTENVKEHQDAHCDGCGNNHKIEKLEIELKATKDKLLGMSKVEKDINELGNKIELHIHGDKELQEVRRKITSPQGMFLIRALTSKWGLWWIGIVSGTSILAFFTHYEFFKAAWNLFHFEG